MKIRNVLSLFDGISCGQLALHRAGIEYDTYYASEIEKQPIWITQYNFPNTIQLGDVEKWRDWDIDWSKIDLLIGGSPCFVAGTLVMTDTGMKPIEKIKIGDYVLTHKGRMRKVLNIGNKLSDTIYKISGYGFKNILTTSNHPFYSRSVYRQYVSHNVSYKRCFTEPKWVKCENLDKNSYLSTTYNKCFTETRKFNSDFWYFVGRFIGDGWVRKSKRKYRKNSFIYQTILCCGKDEFSEVKNIMDRLGYNYNWSEERTTLKFRICSMELEEYLIKIGIGAKNKRIHPDVWNLPKELKKSLIEGYLSADGSFDKNKNTYSYSTISKQLAYEMKLLITEVYNVPVEIHYYDSRKEGIIEGRNVKHDPIFYCKFKLDKRKQDKAFFENHISWQPFKKCEIIKNPTIVYNLEVEEDNSYTADSMIVHNCTNLSIAGNREGLKGEQSRLFYAYVDILNHLKKFNPNIKFLLENVESMSDSDKGIINSHMGCKPIMINSSLVSAQNRKRYYWFNWNLKKESLFGIPTCSIPQPEDKHILLKDILETGMASMDKSITLCARDYKGMGADPINRFLNHQPQAYAYEPICANSKNIISDQRDKDISKEKISDICNNMCNYVNKKYDEFSKKKGYIPEIFSPYNMAEVKEKSPTLTTSGCGPTNINGLVLFENVESFASRIVGIQLDKNGKRVSNSENEFNQIVEVNSNSEKTNTLTTVENTNSINNKIYKVRRKSVCLNKKDSSNKNTYPINLPDGDYVIRKLTPIECERLQTVPDNYTKFGFDGTKNIKISNAARYKALGNGWTVDIISHILSFLV